MSCSVARTLPRLGEKFQLLARGQIAWGRRMGPWRRISNVGPTSRGVILLASRAPWSVDVRRRARKGPPTTALGSRAREAQRRVGRPRPRRRWSSSTCTCSCGTRRPASRAIKQQAERADAPPRDDDPGRCRSPPAPAAPRRPRPPRADRAARRRSTARSASPTRSAGCSRRAASPPPRPTRSSARCRACSISRRSAPARASASSAAPTAACKRFELELGKGPPRAAPSAQPSGELAGESRQST